MQLVKFENYATSNIEDDETISLQLMALSLSGLGAEEKPSPAHNYLTFLLQNVLILFFAINSDGQSFNTIRKTLTSLVRNPV